MKSIKSNSNLNYLSCLEFYITDCDYCEKWLENPNLSRFKRLFKKAKDCINDTTYKQSCLQQQQTCLLINEELDKNQFTINSNINTNLNSNEESELDNESRELRRSVLDWMIIVCHNLKFSEQTFILSTDIFDLALKKIGFNHTFEVYKLLSIASIFISLKFEEVNQLSLDSVVEDIGHNNYTKLDIIKVELEIMKQFCYKLPRNYFLDFTTNIINLIVSESVKLNKNKCIDNENDGCAKNIRSVKVCKKMKKKLNSCEKLEN